MSNKIMEKLGEGYENAIAIIGRNGRFPGAKNVEQLWENLRDGVESITRFTKEDIDTSELNADIVNNPDFVGADAMIEDMDKFDARFFDYSPSEAALIDPQHRLFLEAAWEAMEESGYISEEYGGKIAVYGGANLSSYMIRNIYSNPDLVDKTGIFNIMIANSQDFVATKVSYKLNFTGLSVNVNCLCSSALAATQMASQALLNYECDVAMAGAANLQVSRNESFFYQEGRIGASDGHCRAFDEKANGTVSGSGLAIVVLKRLEDAIEDGDTIHAIIRGAAVNNDGADKNSYTAPNADGQAECVAKAIEESGVDPETITQVEAHGTGTNLGDPIEIAGLTKAFRAYTDKKQYCAIGSLKTNIGHLVNAGGVASLIKAVESLKHKQIPASLNFEKANPKIDFENSPFFVNTKLTEWERIDESTPLRAGVSSCGIGGTNAHVIVEEAPELEPSGSSREYNIISLSAKTSTALEKMTGNLINHIKANPEIKLADIAHTLHVGRLDFNHKKMLVCKDTDELIKLLSDKKSKEVFTYYQKMKEQPVAFLFPSEENVYINMGQELYETEGLFADQIDEIAEYLEENYSLDIKKYILDGEMVDEKTKKVSLFAIEYSLAKMLIEWRITPDYVLGQGMGGYVAASIAEVFTWEEALKILLEENLDLDTIDFQEATIKCMSNVSGTWLKKGEASSSEYWETHIKEANNFEKALEEFMEDPDRIILEIGPGESLCEMAKKLKKTSLDQAIFTMMPSSKEESEIKKMLETIGKYWIAGGKPNWKEFYAEEFRYRIPLPTYPFERESYWIEPGKKIKQNEIEKKDSSDIDFVGRRILKKHPRPDLSVPYAAAESDLEKVIVRIWEESLGIETIGIDDSFFDLGGHSLRALDLTKKIEKIAPELEITDIYEQQTIRALAKFGMENWKNINIENAEFEEEIKEEETKIDSSGLPYFKVIEALSNVKGDSEDSFTIDQVNCFNAPIGMIHGSFKQEYYQLYLIYLYYYMVFVADGYFDDYLEVNEHSPLPTDAYMEFSNRILTLKTGLKINKVEFKGPEDMHNKLMRELAKGAPVLFNIDLYYLEYTDRYKAEHHMSPVIIKGYNKEKELYHILDGKHTGAGYSDFALSYDKMYELKFEGKGEKGQFISIEKTKDFKNTKLNNVEALKDIFNHLTLLKDGKATIKNLEKEFIEELSTSKNTNRCNEMFVRLNFKSVFYTILFRFMDQVGIDTKEMRELVEDMESKWEKVKLNILAKLNSNDFNFEDIKSMEEKNSEISEILRDKILSSLKKVDIVKLAENEKNNEEQERGLIYNNVISDIEIIGEKVKMTLPYDTDTALWTIKNNAPQVLIYPKDSINFEFETTINQLTEEEVYNSQGGLILRLEDDTKYLFGITGKRIALYCPEKGVDCELFGEIYDNRKISLKLTKDINGINFYTKKTADTNWEKNYSLETKEEIRSFGLFGRADYSKYEIEFCDVKYKNNNKELSIKDLLK